MARHSVSLSLSGLSPAAATYEEAAREVVVGLRLLTDAASTSLPSEDSGRRRMLHALQQWHTEQTSLPPGSEVPQTKIVPLLKPVRRALGQLQEAPDDGVRIEAQELLMELLNNQTVLRALGDDLSWELVTITRRAVMGTIVENRDAETRRPVLAALGIEDVPEEWERIRGALTKGVKTLVNALLHPQETARKTVQGLQRIADATGVSRATKATVDFLRDPLAPAKRAFVAAKVEATVIGAPMRARLRETMADVRVGVRNTINDLDTAMPEIREGIQQLATSAKEVGAAFVVVGHAIQDNWRPFLEATEVVAEAEIRRAVAKTTSWIETTGDRLTDGALSAARELGHTSRDTQSLLRRVAERSEKFARASGETLREATKPYTYVAHVERASTRTTETPMPRTSVPLSPVAQLADPARLGHSLTTSTACRSWFEEVGRRLMTESPSARETIVETFTLAANRPSHDKGAIAKLAEEARAVTGQALPTPRELRLDARSGRDYREATGLAVIQEAMNQHVREGNRLEPQEAALMRAIMSEQRTRHIDIATSIQLGAENSTSLAL